MKLGLKQSSAQIEPKAVVCQAKGLPLPQQLLNSFTTGDIIHIRDIGIVSLWAM